MANYEKLMIRAVVEIFPSFPMAPRSISGMQPLVSFTFHELLSLYNTCFTDCLAGVHYQWSKHNNTSDFMCWVCCIHAVATTVSAWE